ncbi:MAG: tRNA epoxyqueuosine(34) reductase QueG [Candidatus Marinimicrobia bacterium]|nr:tRNA epoxyqueuosine(34) reductase QueG [Candidatus Neomarinimicrobiota bacterium]
MVSFDQIQDFARHEGFVAAGISQPLAANIYSNRLSEWIESGYHADMSWMERNPGMRSDLQAHFAWAKSVLVVADSYYSGTSFSIKSPCFSKYALGIDYHKIVAEKLQNILNSLIKIDRKIVGKIYVDTGPILEKAFAEQAGLGWIGKNSIFIVNNIGSFCFLGILILNVALEPSRAVKNRCGNCTKCLDACPTGAIIEPGLVDSRKCISYLTIEKKGAFSDREVKWLNNWLYGCDICQEVCPWNKKWSSKTGEIRYIDRISNLDRSLDDWLKLTAEEFNCLFKNSSLKRLKYERFRRNLMALNNKSFF